MAGRKNFVAGQILTAADVNSFLMNQVVAVFADDDARATAIPNPSEGMITYLQDTDAVEKFDGSAFVNVATDATTSIAGVVLGTTSDGSNTALGDRAFELNTTGIRHTAVGSGALRDNTTGNQNTAVGANALLNNTIGDNNTAVGREALRDITTGDNVAVGRNALRGNTTSINAMGLGNRATSSSNTVSNEITLGNSSITSLRCNVTSISSLSDVRDKTDIVDTQHGLNTLNKIRPVDFTWARRDGTFGSAPDIGFIAQELAIVEDETGDAQRLRFTLRNNPEKLEATPGRLIPILVKAVQELSAKNDELEARIEALEAK